MATPVGGNAQEDAQKKQASSGVTERDKIADFITKGEQIFLNMTRTLQEFSNHGKKLSAVTETVNKLQTEVQQLKRNRASDEDQILGHCPSKKQKVNTVNLDSEDSDGDEGLIQQDSSIGKSIDEMLGDSSSEDSEEEDDLQDLHDQFTEKSETGDSVSERMGDIVSKSLRAVPDEKALQELLDKHRRPANLDILQVQTIDQFLWRDLPQTTKIVDMKLQRSIHQLSNCLVPVIKALDHVRSTKTPDRSLIRELLGDTFKMMVFNITSTNKSRKDKIIQDIHPVYRTICSKAKSSATKLFGDNLKEEAKVLTEKAPHMSLPATKSQPFLRKTGGGSNYNKLPYKMQFKQSGRRYAQKPFSRQKTHQKWTQNHQKVPTQAHRK